jgi:hypothetical protein
MDNAALDALWQLEGRLTDSAGSMEKEANSKGLSAPAAEKLALRAEGLKLARTYVWDAIRERTNGSNGSGPLRVE